MKLNFKESLQSDRSLGWYRNRRAFYLLLHRRGRRGGDALTCSEWAVTHVHASYESSSFEIIHFVPVPRTQRCAKFVVAYVCVCVRSIHVCTHMCNSLLSLQYFPTQWQPIQIQLKRHRGLRSIIHSSVTHTVPPCLSPSPPSVARGWLGGNWVGELHHLLVFLSLCLSLSYFVSRAESAGWTCLTWRDVKMFIWIDGNVLWLCVWISAHPVMSCHFKPYVKT